MQHMIWMVLLVSVGCVDYQRMSRCYDLCELKGGHMSSQYLQCCGCEVDYLSSYPSCQCAPIEVEQCDGRALLSLIKDKGFIRQHTQHSICSTNKHCMYFTYTQPSFALLVKQVIKGAFDNDPLTALNKWLQSISITPTTHVPSHYQQQNNRQYQQQQQQYSVPLKVQISESEHGLGMTAIEDIHELDVILHIPGEYILSYKSLEEITKQPLSGGMYSTVLDIGKSNKEEQLILALLHHFYHLPASPLKAHLVNLPLLPSSPIYTFTKQELQLLNNDPLQSYIQQQQDTLLTLYSSLSTLLASWPTHDRSLFLQGRLTLPFQDLMTAKHIIDTHAYHIQSIQYLVPGGDFINHHPLDNLLTHNTQQIGAQFLATHRLLADHSLQVLASSSFYKHSPVLESYGDNSNLIYVSHHAFITPHNPFDCIPVQLLSNSLVDSLSQPQKLILKLSNNFLQKYCVNDHPLLLMKVLLLLNTINNDDDYQLQECLMRLPADQLHMRYANIHSLYHCVPLVPWTLHPLLSSLLSQLATLHQHSLQLLNDVTKELIVYPTSNNYKLLYQYAYNQLQVITSLTQQLQQQQQSQYRIYLHDEQQHQKQQQYNEYIYYNQHDDL